MLVLQFFSPTISTSFPTISSFNGMSVSWHQCQIKGMDDGDIEGRTLTPPALPGIPCHVPRVVDLVSFVHPFLCILDHGHGDGAVHQEQDLGPLSLGLQGRIHRPLQVLEGPHEDAADIGI